MSLLRRVSALGGVSQAGSGVAIWIVLAVLMTVATLLSSAFLDPINLANIVRQATPVGIVAVGATIVMILGCIDLSVGAIVSLAAVFSAIQMSGQADNTAFAIVSTLLVCGLLGMVNGLLVAYNPASSFIMTLGTGLAVYGLVQVYSGGVAKGIVAPGFREFFNYRLSGIIPVIAIALVILVCLVELLLRWSRFGRHVYLIGSNSAAARIAGLPVTRTIVLGYLLSGVFAGLGGIALLANSGVSTTMVGRGFELDSLAAIVLGGTVFEGGRGSAAGTIAGVLVLFVAFNIVNILGLNFNLQLVVKGCIVIIASTAYIRLQRSR